MEGKVNDEIEIKYNELIDQSRKLSSEDFIKSEYKVNLAMISKNLDIASKVQAWSLKTFIHFKSNNMDQLLTYCKKTLRLLERIKISDIDTSSIFCLIKILYRCGMILQENKILFTAAYCMHKAKNLFYEKGINDEEESFNTLGSNFSILLKQISQEVNFILK